MDNLEFEKYYQAKGFAAQRRYPNEELIRFLAVNYFHLSPARRRQIKILELGCGSGANLWMIAKEGFNAYGLDISPTGIKLCARAMKPWGVKADLRVGNMKKIDFADEFFDAIVDVVSVQHTDLKGHLKTYQEVFRCLKPSGRFFQWHLGADSVSFVEGKGKAIDELTIDNIANSEVPFYNCGLTCFLTPEKAEEMLKLAGFKNVNVEIFTRTYKNRTQLIQYLSIQAQKA